MRNCFALAFLFLFLSAPTFVQQSSFIVQDDRNEPCRRFKMRVLIPIDDAKRDLSVRKPSDSIDPKMVWNPCRNNDLQLATVFPAPKPENGKGNNYVLVNLDALEQKLRSLRLKPAAPPIPLVKPTTPRP